MSTSDRRLRVTDLRKVYRRTVVANDGITLYVEPGEVYGLLGPNGAGKSTLVKQVIGLLKPTSGSIRLGAHDLVASPGVARQLCSYLPQAQMPIDVAVVGEAEADPAIAWARTLTDAGVVEEYALGAVTLEDAYIQLTGHTSLDGQVDAS